MTAFVEEMAAALAFADGFTFSELPVDVTPAELKNAYASWLPSKSYYRKQASVAVAFHAERRPARARKSRDTTWD